jgi:hypothetical protein
MNKTYFSSDEVKWSNNTKEDNEKIAKQWSRKYSTKKLREFQLFYQSLLGGLIPLTESELKGEITDGTIAHNALCNRLDTVAMAIDIKEFR